MFCNCINLKLLNLNGFNTENVEYMKSMFSSCNVLEELDLRSFKTNKVKDFSTMFGWCFKLENLYINNFEFSDSANIGQNFFINVSNKNLKIYVKDLATKNRLVSELPNTSKLNERNFICVE